MSSLFRPPPRDDGRRMPRVSSQGKATTTTPFQFRLHRASANFRTNFSTRANERGLSHRVSPVVLPAAAAGGGQVQLHRTRGSQQQSKQTHGPASQVTTSVSMEEVLADLHVLEKQQHESQQKLASAEMSKQNRLKQFADQEEQMIQIQSSNEQWRAQIKQARALMSTAANQLTISRRQNETCQETLSALVDGKLKSLYRIQFFCNVVNPRRSKKNWESCVEPGANELARVDQVCRWNIERCVLSAEKHAKLELAQNALVKTSQVSAVDKQDRLDALHQSLQVQENAAAEAATAQGKEDGLLTRLSDSLLLVKNDKAKCHLDLQKQLEMLRETKTKVQGQIETMRNEFTKMCDPLQSGRKGDIEFLSTNFQSQLINIYKSSLADLSCHVRMKEEIVDVGGRLESLQTRAKKLDQDDKERQSKEGAKQKIHLACQEEAASFTRLLQERDVQTKQNGKLVKDKEKANNEEAEQLRQNLKQASYLRAKLKELRCLCVEKETQVTEMTKEIHRKTQEAYEARKQLLAEDEDLLARQSERAAYWEESGKSQVRNNIDVLKRDTERLLRDLEDTGFETESDAADLDTGLLQTKLKRLQDESSHHAKTTARIIDDAKKDVPLLGSVLENFNFLYGEKPQAQIEVALEGLRESCMIRLEAAKKQRRGRARERANKSQDKSADQAAMDQGTDGHRRRKKNAAFYQPESQSVGSFGDVSPAQPKKLLNAYHEIKKNTNGDGEQERHELKGYSKKVHWGDSKPKVPENDLPPPKPPKSSTSKVEPTPKSSTSHSKVRDKKVSSSILKKKQQGGHHSKSYSRQQGKQSTPKASLAVQTATTEIDSTKTTMASMAGRARVSSSHSVDEKKRQSNGTRKASSSSKRRKTSEDQLSQASGISTTEERVPKLHRRKKKDLGSGENPDRRAGGGKSGKFEFSF